MTPACNSSSSTNALILRSNLPPLCTIGPWVQSICAGSKSEGIFCLFGSSTVVQNLASSILASTLFANALCLTFFSSSSMFDISSTKYGFMRARQAFEAFRMARYICQRGVWRENQKPYQFALILNSQSSSRDCCGDINFLNIL